MAYPCQLTHHGRNPKISVEVLVIKFTGVPDYPMMSTEQKYCFLFRRKLINVSGRLHVLASIHVYFITK